MSVFSQPDFDNHEQIIFGSDGESGLRCIIAIHSTRRGPALGGCRMRAYASEDEAVRDALRLSRGMTYKAAIADLPFGGGKAVIIGDPRTQKTEALLRAFGRFLESLDGRYITAEDMGTTVADMDVVRRETRFARGFSDGSGNPSPATAFGVFNAIRAAVEHRLGRGDLRGVRVAAQGLGNVGYRLCDYLAAAGAQVFVTDLWDEPVRRAVREFGAHAVAPDDIYDLDVDVFAPCALGAVINDDTLDRLHATVVAGSANNQLAEARHGEALRRRNILYAPDYVANAGGLIDVAYENAGHSQQTILKMVESISETLKRIFARADAENVATSVIADRLAEEKLRAGGPATIAA